MDLQKIIDTQKKHEKSLIRKANVTSVGCGYRFKDGKQTEEICIIVGVGEKVPETMLSTFDVIPRSVDGVAIDVVETGTIKAEQAIDPTKKFRPAMPGISIVHKNITSGTFGCVVEKSGTKLILSNNHVLANSNDARIGDDIYQPGSFDQGTFNDKIGTLFDFVPIDFGGFTDPKPPTCPIAKGTAGTVNAMAAILGRKHRLVAFNMDPLAATNEVDAAVALPGEDSDITDEIVEIGKPAGVKQHELGMEIQKYGRTTHYTTGVVLQVNVTVQVSYGPSGTATFIGQFMGGNMSAGGDSGSACLDMNKNVVGLLFAGSDTTTIFNPIQDVFDALNVTL